ncbi:MAG: C1 family peptidase, partial [Thermodesulfobacteriota bacterium]|nr:C1 family peptidase [Thermodesulfobacteriota bacterium]
MEKCNRALFATAVISVLLFMVSPTSFADSKGILAFEPGDTIEEIREKIEHNGYSFTVDNNWVYDMDRETKGRFFSRYAPLVPRAYSRSDDIGPLANHLQDALPATFDWRNHNGRSYIGSVRDQGNCGSCYAFGACAAAEGTYNYAMGLHDANSVDFSEAFVAFCLSDHYSGFDGCDGSSYDYE